MNTTIIKTSLSSFPKLMSRTMICAFIYCVISPCTYGQVSTDSLLLEMHFNGDAMDYSGNGNNGTLFNVLPDTNRFGESNMSYNFNGTDSYIEIAASPSMNMIQTVDEVSISAWINIDQWHVSGNVFSIFERYNPNTDSGWLLEANWAGGGILFLADESSPTNWAGCDFTWNFDQWYHLGFTYSQAQGMAKFYVDGINVCSTSYTPEINVADTTSSFIIGRSLAGPDEYSDGLIDDYKIYYRVLSDEEIDETFELGKEEIRSSTGYEVFPNPVRDVLTIKTTPENDRAAYTISDITGRNYFTGQLQHGATGIDMHDLPSGIYFLKIGGAKPLTKKILKL